MAYLSTEKAKSIREKIKAEFPAKDGWKFSITCKNYSSLYINILTAPLNFEVKERDERQLWHNSDFKENFPSDQAEALEKIAKIARSQGWYDKSEPMTDYFDTAYYINITIGHWEKGFKYVEKPKKAAKQAKNNDVVSLEPIKTEGLELIKYSDKCYALFGHTKPYKDVLGRNGLQCAFNYKLTHPVTKDKTPGWIVNNAKLERVKQTLSL